MKIAILMSTYNGEKYLDEQLESIFKQNINAKITPTIFCAITRSTARIRNDTTLIPPSFNTLKLAVKPMLVKKAVINIFCNAVSKFIEAIPVI